MDNTNDKQRQSIAKDLVIKCGVPPCLRGCTYLAKATELYAEGTYSFSDIYRTIAAKHSAKPKSVMRDISYAVDQSFDIRDRLYDLIGVKIPKDQIHNSLIISYLAHELNVLTDDNNIT